MHSTIITTIVSLICSAISGAITFAFTKKKYNAEVDSQQIKNMNDSFEAYKKMMQDVLNLQNKKIEMLEQENKTLRAQLTQLQEQLTNIVIAKVSKKRK